MNHHYPILNLYSAKLLSYLVLLFRFNCHQFWDARLRIQIHKIKVKSRAVHNVLCGCSVTTVPNLNCNPPDCVGVALGPITIILFHMPLARICRMYIHGHFLLLTCYCGMEEKIVDFITMFTYCNLWRLKQRLWHSILQQQSSIKFSFAGHVVPPGAGGAYCSTGRSLGAALGFLPHWCWLHIRQSCTQKYFFPMIGSKPNLCYD